MILRDADTGKVIWQENKDLSSSEEEHRAQIPTKILDLRAVSREINFSTVESLKNFRLDQKVRPPHTLLNDIMLCFNCRRSFFADSVQRSHNGRVAVRNGMGKFQGPHIHSLFST